MGLAAICTKPVSETVQMIYGYEEAVAAFGKEEGITKLAAILLKNGASAVAAYPVKTTENYEDAFAALNQQEGISVLLCDATDETVQLALKTAVEEAATLRRERIGVVSGGASATVQELIDRAAALSCERMVLVAPEVAEESLAGPSLAAAVAGAIAGELDPAVPLGGVVLKGISNVTQTYTDEALDALIRGGVTVVEREAASLIVVRAVTTRTQTGGVPDQTWRELSTIRIVDDVIPSIRTALRSRFTRSKNTQQVRSAIRSQVILELENKLSQEIITEYGEVTVQALADNPTVCLVQFSFTVAHGLNQIWLSAQITI